MPRSCMSGVTLDARCNGLSGRTLDAACNKLLGVKLDFQADVAVCQVLH